MNLRSTIHAHNVLLATTGGFFIGVGVMLVIIPPWFAQAARFDWDINTIEVGFFLFLVGLFISLIVSIIKTFEEAKETPLDRENS